MKKFFFKDEKGQYGPFDFEELKDKTITADTPIWHEGLDNWTTASQVEELKDLIIPAISPITGKEIPAGELKVDEAPVSVAENTATAVKETNPAANIAPEESKDTVSVPPQVTAAANTALIKSAAKQNKTWISWALSLAAIIGAGFYVYQDVQKNKNKYQGAEITTNDSTGVQKTDADSVIGISQNENSDTGLATDKTIKDTSKNTSADPTLTVTTKSVDPATARKAEEEKKKKQAELARKKEEDKKKQLVAEAKHKEEQKKLEAAQAAAAKEIEMRNNWPRYVSLGSFNNTEDEVTRSFSIPIYNSYPFLIDKITLRVDYLKREKVVGSETLILNNIPTKSSQNAQAAGHKKAKKVNVYITGINCSQLHFCYPQHNGNPADPHFCN